MITVPAEQIENVLAEDETEDERMNGGSEAEVKNGESEDKGMTKNESEESRSEESTGSESENGSEESGSEESTGSESENGSGESESGDENIDDEIQNGSEESESGEENMDGVIQNESEEESESNDENSENENESSEEEEGGHVQDGPPINHPRYKGSGFLTNAETHRLMRRSVDIYLLTRHRPKPVIFTNSIKTEEDIPHSIKTCRRRIVRCGARGALNYLQFYLHQPEELQKYRQLCRVRYARVKVNQNKNHALKRH